VKAANIRRKFFEGLTVTNNPNQPDVAIGADPGPSSPEPQESRWAFINGWRVEPQSNDRAPVTGAMVPNAGAAAAVRSMTRRKHQASFKEWSQSRHE
jgi:hypothetical protein